MWLLCTTYRPPAQNNNYLCDNIDKGLDVSFLKKKIVTLAGDFNAEVGIKSFETFLYKQKLTFINTDPNYSQTLRTLIA